MCKSIIVVVVVVYIHTDTVLNFLLAKFINFYHSAIRYKHQNLINFYAEGPFSWSWNRSHNNNVQLATASFKFHSRSPLPMQRKLGESVRTLSKKGSLRERCIWTMCKPYMSSRLARGNSRYSSTSPVQSMA